MLLEFYGICHDCSIHDCTMAASSFVSSKRTGVQADNVHKSIVICCKSYHNHNDLINLGQEANM